MLLWIKTVLLTGVMCVAGAYAENHSGQNSTSPTSLQGQERASNSSAQTLGRAGNSSAQTLERPDKSSTLPKHCAKHVASVNETLDLFSRRLTREEYYRRNFMWIRCRTLATHWYDMGGSWFGRDGKKLKIPFLNYPVTTWEFKYVNGDWGDATLFFNELATTMSFKEFFSRMRPLANAASARHGRNFYIIDCPGLEHDPFYATERRGIPFPNPGLAKSPTDLRAVYHLSAQRSLRGNRQWEFWPAVPAVHSTHTQQRPNQSTWLEP